MKLKTHIYLSILIVIMLLFVPSMLAQTPAPSIETLHVAFWPDFDEPSVLVLMTGSLPPDADLPAQVSIPLPANADVNAVARLNNEVGMADTEFEINGNVLTLTTPDPQFRVEYYVPYVDDGGWRLYDFVWNSDIDVQELTAEIQQPSSASSLLSEPPAATSVTNPSDNLIYHGFSPQTIEAGTPYEISFRYNSTGSNLTVGQQESLPDLDAEPDRSASQGSRDINWVTIVLGIVLLVLVAIITWFIATRYASKNNRKPRKSQKPRKPGPRSRTAQSTSKQTPFCHSCGTQAEADDKFCRSCGTELKRT